MRLKLNTHLESPLAVSWISHVFPNRGVGSCKIQENNKNYLNPSVGIISLALSLQTFQNTIPIFYKV